MSEKDLFSTTIRPGPNFHHFYSASVGVTEGKEGRPVETKSLKDWNDPIIHEKVRENISRMGFQRPTPVQATAAYPILDGADVVAISETGSGKTAALLAPLITSLLKDKDANHPPDPASISKGTGPLVTALLILPARELAIQQYMEALKFSYGTKLRVRLIYGGKPGAQQRHLLSQGADLLVATPGRLCEFIANKWISCAALKYLVVDEADQVITKQFMAEVENELLKVRPDLGRIQVVFTSATFPESMQEVVTTFLHPNFLFVKTGRSLAANTDVQQSVELCYTFDEKKTTLLSLLRSDCQRYTARKNEDGSFASRTVVFVNRIKTLFHLQHFLKRAGIPSARPIHSDLTQEEREFDLEDFRLGKVPILLGTDVVARGIDIGGIDHVILFDLPNYVNEGLDMATAQYVQRIGRTGRVGNAGRATSFFCPSKDLREMKPDGDRPLLKHIVRVLQDSQQHVSPWMLRPIPGFENEPSSPRTQTTASHSQISSATPSPNSS